MLLAPYAEHMSHSRRKNFEFEFEQQQRTAASPLRASAWTKCSKPLSAASRRLHILQGLDMLIKPHASDRLWQSKPGTLCPHQNRIAMRDSHARRSRVSELHSLLLLLPPFSSILIGPFGGRLPAPLLTHLLSHSTLRHQRHCLWVKPSGLAQDRGA